MLRLCLRESFLRFYGVVLLNCNIAWDVVFLCRRFTSCNVSGLQKSKRKQTNKQTKKGPQEFPGLLYECQWANPEKKRRINKEIGIWHRKRVNLYCIYYNLVISLTTYCISAVIHCRTKNIMTNQILHLDQNLCTRKAVTNTWNWFKSLDMGSNMIPE